MLLNQKAMGSAAFAEITQVIPASMVYYLPISFQRRKFPKLVNEKKKKFRGLLFSETEKILSSKISFCTQMPEKLCSIKIKLETLGGGLGFSNQPSALCCLVTDSQAT